MFEIHAKELIVGEIFVRIYNEQPTFPLEVLFLCCKVERFLNADLIRNSHFNEIKF